MFNKKVGLIALLLSLAFGDSFAGTLANYTVGDVLLCFRSTAAYDLVVDVGPISTFTNASPNQRIPITQYNGSQLALVGTNKLSWSAFTWFDLTVSPTSVQGTLFVSNPRTSVNTQSSFPPQDKRTAQLQVVNQMSPIAAGANDNLSYNAVNTTTAVAEPDNNSNPDYITGQSYSFSLGPNLNFNDTYGGFPENITPVNFTLAGAVQRSDFYWIPTTTSGGSEVYLGYFELNTNGAMTYVAYPSAVPATPVVTGITRTNNVSYISFTTGSSGTYTLRGTNSAGISASRTNWPAITSAPGTGSIVTLQDATTDSGKFYVITAQ